VTKTSEAEKDAVAAGEAAAFEYSKTGGGPIGVFLSGLKAYREALATPAPEPQPEVAADLIERCAAQIEPGLWPMMDEHDRNLHRAIAKRILALANPPVVEEAVKAETEACAALAEERGKHLAESAVGSFIAKAIRARSATP